MKERISLSPKRLKEKDEKTCSECKSKDDAWDKSTVERGYCLGRKIDDSESWLESLIRKMNFKPSFSFP